jgi:hypothetical protein
VCDILFIGFLKSIGECCPVDSGNPQVAASRMKAILYEANACEMQYDSL